MATPYQLNLEHRYASAASVSSQQNRALKPHAYQFCFHEAKVAAPRVLALPAASAGRNRYPRHDSNPRRIFLYGLIQTEKRSARHRSEGSHEECTVLLGYAETELSPGGRARHAGRKQENGKTTREAQMYQAICGEPGCHFQSDSSTQREAAVQRHVHRMHQPKHNVAVVKDNAVKKAKRVKHVYIQELDRDET